MKAMASTASSCHLVVCSPSMAEINKANSSSRTRNRLATNLKASYQQKMISNNLSSSSSSSRREARNVVVRAEVAKPQMDNLSGVVTDAAVPEGHKGLHGFLYGEGDAADIHGSPGASSKEFRGRAGEDDGSSILDFEEYVSARESEKFSGVYAVYDASGRLQFVGYSRNVVLSLKTHRRRVGGEKCSVVRVKLFAVASIVSRANLEDERQQWLEREKSVPAGNSHENHLWERSSSRNGSSSSEIKESLQLMTEEERTEYEEKKLKLRKAMGENLHDEVEGEEEGSRIRRLKLLAATENDDWSAVIDGQTQLTVQETPTCVEVEPLAANANANADNELGNSTAIESPFAHPGVPIVSPFDERPTTAGNLYSEDVYELTVENVDLVLNDVRPYLISDGGNVEVVSVDNGIVSLRLQGACGTCPSSTVTMKMGIEKVLNEKFGAALKGVAQVDQLQIGATILGVNAHLEMLRPAIHNYGGYVEVVSVDTASGVSVIKFKGPAPIGMGIQAAIKDKFPDIKDVVLVDRDHLVQV